MKERNQKLLQHYEKEYRRLTSGRDLKEDLNMFINQIKDPSYWALVVCEYFDVPRNELFNLKEVESAAARKWFYYLSRINGISFSKICQYSGASRTYVSTSSSSLHDKITKGDRELKDIRTGLLNKRVSSDIKGINKKEEHKSIDHWADVICKYFKIPFSGLLHSNTLTYHIPKRWFYFICVYDGHNRKDIASYTGKNSSTPTAVLRKHREEMKKDPGMYETLAALLDFEG